MPKLSGDARTYQKLICAAFPTVVVRDNLGGPAGLEDLVVLDVFFVPDARRREFEDFVLEQLAEECDALNLPTPIIVTHSTSATAEYYPEIFAEHTAIATLGHLNADASTWLVSGSVTIALSPGAVAVCFGAPRRAILGPVRADRSFAPCKFKTHVLAG